MIFKGVVGVAMWWEMLSVSTMCPTVGFISSNFGCLECITINLINLK